MTDFLLQPDIAYLTLVVTALLTFMALLTPGTGILEIGAIFALLISGWQVYNLPINAWALVILVLSVVPFWMAVRQTRGNWFLIGAIVALVVGSLFLFQGDGRLPAVNPIVAVIVSTLSSGFVWLLTSKTMEAQRSTPAHDLGGLVGAIGVARTDIHQEGTVYVRMENWSAQSVQPIPAGASVRVIGREGLILQVETVSTAEQVEQPA